NRPVDTARTRTTIGMAIQSQPGCTDAPGRCRTHCAVDAAPAFLPMRARRIGWRGTSRSPFVPDADAGDHRQQCAFGCMCDPTLVSHRPAFGMADRAYRFTGAASVERAANAAAGLSLVCGELC